MKTSSTRDDEVCGFPRRRRRLRGCRLQLAGGIILCGCWVGNLQAQEPAGESDKLFLTPPVEERRFRVNAQGGSRYESNARLTGGVGVASRTDNAGISALSAYRSGRTKFSFTASADIARNSKLPDFNHESFSGSVDVTNAVTPRANVGLIAGAQSSLAIDLSRGLYSNVTTGSTSSAPSTPGTGGDAGTGALIAPTARILIADVGLNSSIRLTEAVTLSGDVSFTQTNYASRALADGRSSNGSVVVGQQVSQRFRVEGVLAAVRTSSTAPGSAVSGVQTMTMAGTWQFVPRISVRVNGGASRSTLEAVKPAIGTTGGVQFSANTERLAATLYVDRRAAPSFGLERILASNAAGLTLVQTIGAGSTLNASVHRVQSSANVGSALQFSTTDGDVGIQQHLFGRFQLTASSFLHRRSDTITVQDLGVSLGFSVPLR